MLQYIDKGNYFELYSDKRKIILEDAFKEELNQDIVTIE